MPAPTDRPVPDSRPAEDEQGFSVRLWLGRLAQLWHDLPKLCSQGVRHESCRASLVSAVVHAMVLIVLGLLTLEDSSQPRGISLVATADTVNDSSVDFQTVAMEADTASLVLNSGGTDQLGSLLSAGLEPTVPATTGDDLVMPLETVSLGGGAPVIGAGEVGAGEQKKSSGNGDQQASFFGTKARGKSFVFILDASGSMHEEFRFVRAIDELQKSLRKLTKGQRYFVMFFNDQVFEMPGGMMLSATPENLKDTYRWLESIRPDGSTFPAEAVVRAYDLKPDAIFLLSDGIFSTETIEFLERKRATEGPKALIPVHTIALGNQAGVEMLREISYLTRGAFRWVRR